VIRSDISARSLADQLMLFLGATCVEWSDRGFEFEELRERLCGGYETLMNGAISRGELRFSRNDGLPVGSVESRFA
jgi:hypothetical protein